MADQKEKNVIKAEEIDLVQVIKAIWAGRLLIAKVAGVFAVLGLIIAFTSPVEYQASCKLLPESEKTGASNLGGLAGLAGLAGVDLSSMTGGGSTAMTPELYPEIVYSLPFMLEVMNDTIYFEHKGLHTTTFSYFREYANSSIMGTVKKYTLGLPHLIKMALVEKTETSEDTTQFYRLSIEDWELIKKFKNRISIEIESGTGIIQVRVEMPDPYAAAQVTKKIETLVTEAVKAYKTDKSLKNLEFIQSTYNEAKQEFESVQLKLAASKDRNKNISSATAQIEQKKMAHEFEIAFSIYKGLSSQLEQAKIQLKKQTPVFTILEPVRIPEGKSKPRRLMILMASTIVGVFAASALIFVRDIL